VLPVAQHAPSWVETTSVDKGRPSGQQPAAARSTGHGVNVFLFKANIGGERWRLVYGQYSNGTDERVLA